MKLKEELLDEANEKILNKLDNIFGVKENKKVLRDIVKYSQIMKKYKCNIEFENYNIILRNDSSYNSYEELIPVIAEIYYKNRITRNDGVYYAVREDIKDNKIIEDSPKEDVIVIDLEKLKREMSDLKEVMRELIFEMPTKAFIIIDNSFVEGLTNASLNEFMTWSMKIEKISLEEKINYTKKFINENGLECDNETAETIADKPFWQLKNDLISILVNCKASKEKDVKKILKPETEVKKKKERKRSAEKELNKLIGMEEVKKELKKIINYISVGKNRNNMPMLHMCFSGNPGTGKTTVARIVGKLFEERNILSEKGKFVEAQRADLIGEYVGQTAPRTERVISRAEGGVLFIDEAYSIASYIQDEAGRDYGAECIATLLKEMEDKRDNLCVILAGYTKEMENMLKVNPGFQSRIQFTINFPDYTAEELYEIFKNLCKEEKYILSSNLKSTLVEHFEQARKKENFSNGRYVRSLFEKIKIEQANRVFEDDTASRCVIRKCDIEEVIKKVKPEKQEKIKIGFVS